MGDPMQSFVAQSTWILEHSDDYIIWGWRLLSVVGGGEFIAAVLLIVARAMVGETSNAAAKYGCTFVLRDKYLVPYENPAGSGGTCSEATIYLDRGNNASVVCIIFLLFSVILDLWTPVRKREHGFCECNRLNVMCGVTWFVHMMGIFSAVCAAVGYNENYRIWDTQACLDNPYVGGGLDGTNPYGDGCSVALLATTLAWIVTITYFCALFLLLCEVCR